MLSFALKAMAIAVRLAALNPPATALDHVPTAALVASQVAPEILIAVAWHESQFDPTATSYVTADGRRAGARARGEVGRGPRFCGVMQVAAGHRWADCLALRPLLDGYRRGHDVLVAWLRAARGDLAAALRGYGCGFAGMRGECRDFDRRVLRTARAIGWRP